MHCLHYPYSVSAALKLLVDGMNKYHHCIKKVDDLLFNIIIIDFHYTATLDEAILSKMQMNNDHESPTKLKSQSTVLVKNQRLSSWLIYLILFFFRNLRVLSLKSQSSRWISEYFCKLQPRSNTPNFPFRCLILAFPQSASFVRRPIQRRFYKFHHPTSQERDSHDGIPFDSYQRHSHVY